MLPCIFTSRTSLHCAIDHVSYLILTISVNYLERDVFLICRWGEWGLGLWKFPREMKTCLRTKSIWLVMSVLVLITEPTIFRCWFCVSVCTEDFSWSLSWFSRWSCEACKITSQSSASLSNLLKVTQLRVYALNLNLIMRKWGNKSSLRYNLQVNNWPGLFTLQKCHYPEGKTKVRELDRKKFSLKDIVGIVEVLTFSIVSVLIPWVWKLYCAYIGE